MRALVYEGEWQMPLREVKPPVPGDNDVIVQVKAAGICGSDVHGYAGITGRRTPPIVMGHEFGGVISEIGARVADYAPGDRVVIQPLWTCGKCESCTSGVPSLCLNRSGIGINTDGAFADAVRVPHQLLRRLPAEMTWEQAAMIEPLAVAMRAVNRSPIKLMDTVVIVGAGTIGLLALTMAKLKGAGQVIISDLSTHRLELAKQLGADMAVNVKEQDVVQIVRAQTDGVGASIVIEAVGASATVRQALSVVRSGGHITWIGNSQPEVALNMQTIVTREITVTGTYCYNDEFERALQAIHTQRVNVAPLIERVAPLEEGPQLIHDLAKGTLEAVKVILVP
ncbi:MAG: galactitol-1-phosphate 5-dehydrogenase [Chloroflexi bacterium]|nr:galactitol-1-phosphate 5-dehydrogenase [Chloroflexota bacterium]